MLYGLYEFAYLVYAAAVRGGPAAPLVAVDGTQVPVLVGPFIPYGNSVFLEVAYVGAA